MYCNYSLLLQPSNKLYGHGLKHYNVLAIHHTSSWGAGETLSSGLQQWPTTKYLGEDEVCSAAGALDAAWQGARLHPAGHIDSVSKQSVPARYVSLAQREEFESHPPCHCQLAH